MTVGERIRERRVELGLSQGELAKRMGYSGKSSVCKAETCDDNITTTKVTKFAKALSCTFEYLMGWTDNFDEELDDDLKWTMDFDDSHYTLLELYDSLDKDKQKEALKYLDYLSKN